MAVELRWQEEGRTILTTYSGSVTADELTRIIEAIIKQLNQSTRTLHVIVDWRQATDYPYFVDFMFTGLKLIRHPRMGWVVLVGKDATLKIWVDLFAHISDFHYKIVPTLEEGVDFARSIIV